MRSEEDMKVIYDPDTDTLNIVFRDDAISESDEIREGIIVDYSREGKIVSVEVLDASEHITDPNSIAYELKGRQRANYWSMLTSQ